MSITGITGIARVPATIADTPAATTTASPNPRSASATPVVEIDQVTQLPLQPRFPWLSRLSQQLESAARQKPAFAPAPILGDHVDRSV
jgi:hypothetical protein